MNDLCLFSEKHTILERILFLAIGSIMLGTACINIRMSLVVFPCSTTPEFMMLTMNRWVLSSWIGKVVFAFMEYIYSGINPLTILFMCCNGTEIIGFFGSIIMNLQVSKRWGVRFRKSMLMTSLILRLLSLLILLCFIFLTLNSLTTEKAFSCLSMGTLIYGIGNLLSIIPIIVGTLTSAYK